MEHFVITIARGFGSGGKEIGMRLAKELGISCYDKRILELASEYSGVSREIFERVDERFSSEKIRKALGNMSVSREISSPPYKDFDSDIKLFNIQAHIIRQLAESESCIIVGKCADNLLAEYKNVVSVYVEAPREYCRKRIMEKFSCTPDEANRLIYQTDLYRAEYYKYYSGGNEWTNVTNYDLTINTGRLGPDIAVNLIKSCLRQKLGAEA
ncbi:cytidylate kinase-like family protein [Lachnospiraceae bacterium 54-53]